MLADLPGCVLIRILQMARSINHRGLNKLASLTLSGTQLLHRMSRAVRCTPQLNEDLPVDWHGWQAAWWVQRKTGGDAPSLLSWYVKAVVTLP